MTHPQKQPQKAISPPIPRLYHYRNTIPRDRAPANRSPMYTSSAADVTRDRAEQVQSNTHTHTRYRRRRAVHEHTDRRPFVQRAFSHGEQAVTGPSEREREMRALAAPGRIIPGRGVLGA